MSQANYRRPLGYFTSLAGAFSAVLISMCLYQPQTLAAAACVQPPPDLVSWWTGDGNADDVWSGINGTLQNGVSFAAGEVGQAFSFDRASAQFVQASNAPGLNFDRTDAFSIDAWVRTTETAHNVFIASKQPNTPNFHGYGLAITNGEAPQCDASNPAAAGAGQLFFFLDGAVANNCPPDDNIAVRGSTQLNDGNWHHVVATYDGSGTAAGVKLYVDGVEETEVVQEDTLGSQSISNNVPFDIGSRDAGGVPFNGQIDEVEVFDSVVSAADIQAIFNAGSAGKCKPAIACTPPLAGMVSWWPGDGNSNDIWGGNNGTTEGGASFGSGIVDQAFHFVAADSQFVQIPNASDLNFERTDPFSIDAWIRTSDAAVNEFIAAKRTADSPFTGYGLLIDNGPPHCEPSDNTAPGAGVLTFFLDNSDSASCPRDHSIIVRGATKVNDGRWHHIAVTYDGSASAAGVKIYVDGVPDSLSADSNNLAATTITNDAPFLIAVDSTNGVQPFDGSIDEFEVFDRVLSQAEIQNIVNARTLGKCKPSPVAGKLRITPAKINFGAVKVNKSLTKMLTITNLGRITRKKHPLPITVQTETESGMPAPDPFSITTECSAGALQPKGKGVPRAETRCKVGVEFAPTQPGTYAGSLSIFDNLSGNGVRQIPISGKGKAAQ